MKEMVMQYLGEALVNEMIIVYMWQDSNQIFFGFVQETGKQIFNAKLNLHESIKLDRGDTLNISSKLWIQKYVQNAFWRRKKNTHDIEMYIKVCNAR